MALFQALRTYFFSLKEKIFYKPTPVEIDIIKKTNLFRNVNENQFGEMIKSVKLARYSKGTMILHENEPGGDIFIIVDGSVRVFIVDRQGVKIPLKKMNKGDYFGEDSLLSKTHKTRNAYIEAIADTITLKIPEKFYADALEIDAELKNKLEETRYQRALHALSLSTDFYNEIEAVISKVENPTILEFSNNEYIFKVGDTADNVYVILQGKVKLLIPDKMLGTFSRVMLHRGTMFGELGVIRNTARSATAIAHSNLRVLAIECDYFKKTVLENPQLQQTMAILQQTYQIPMRGIVEQYVGNVQGMGNSITNIYKLEDGRIVISAKFFNQDIFTMTTSHVKNEMRYQYKKGVSRIELDVSDNHLVGIRTYGIWDSLADLCEILLDNRVITESAFEDFELSGNLNKAIDDQQDK